MHVVGKAREHSVPIRDAICHDVMEFGRYRVPRSPGPMIRYNRQWSPRLTLGS